MIDPSDINPGGHNVPHYRVSQVYLAIDDRLTSLKTDTFSKTREEKMEDLFAQKDVGIFTCVCACACERVFLIYLHFS